MLADQEVSSRVCAGRVRGQADQRAQGQARGQPVHFYYRGGREGPGHSSGAQRGAGGRGARGAAAGRRDRGAHTLRKR